MDPREQLRSNLEALDSAVAEVAAFFREHERSAAKGEGWGPKEVLAHFVHWHEQSCLNAEVLLEGKAVSQFARSSDDVNAEVVPPLTKVPTSEMVERLIALQARFSKDLLALPDPTAIIIHRSNGQQISVMERPAVMARHFRGHLEEMRSR